MLDNKVKRKRTSSHIDRLIIRFFLYVWWIDVTSGSIYSIRIIPTGERNGKKKKKGKRNKERPRYTGKHRAAMHNDHVKIYSILGNTGNLGQIYLN